MTDYRGYRIERVLLHANAAQTEHMVYQRDPKYLYSILQEHSGEWHEVGCASTEPDAVAFIDMLLRLAA